MRRKREFEIGEINIILPSPELGILEIPVEFPTGSVIETLFDTVLVPIRIFLHIIKSSLE